MRGLCWRMPLQHMRALVVVLIVGQVEGCACLPVRAVSPVSLAQLQRPRSCCRQSSDVHTRCGLLLGQVRGVFRPAIHVPICT